MDYSYYYYNTYDYDPTPYTSSIDSSSAVAGLSAALGAFVGVVLIVSLVIAILQIIALWKIYTKAGEKGWKCIIPIYNMVVLFKIAGISPWLILLYLLAIIPFVGWIAPLVLTIYLAHSIAKSFGKDVGYTIGLIFLPVIFYMILGFGSAEYVGPAGMTTSSTEE